MKKFFFLTAVLISVNVQAQKIKAISFNIRFANVNDGNNQWELRKESVTDFLKYEEADFVGMQEALLSQIEYMDSEVSNMAWIGVGRDDGKNKGEFSPVFYNSDRWSLEKKETFWLSETPGTPSKSWDAALPRICTYGVFTHKKSGRQIYVFNTHYDHIGKEARLNSSKLIVQKIREISGFENTILLGDFNAEKDTEVIRVLYKSPLQDAYLSAKIRFGQKGTFTGFDTNKIPERRIDYVFHSLDLKPLKYGVDSRIIDGRYLSDHFPVIVQFE